MKSLFGGLLIATGAVVLAVGVLAGVELLLRNQDRRRRITRRAEGDAVPAVPRTNSSSRPLPARASGEESALLPKQDAQRNFSIKRTKSEVGYVYWILEGYRKYKCFILCDTWDEAVEQAKAKQAEVDGVSEASTRTVATTA